MKVKVFAVGLGITLAACGPAFGAGCTLSAEAQAGKLVSNKCKSCHVFEAGKPSANAPNLHDVFGDVAADRRDFKYSDAMNGASDKHLIWNESNLFDYLADPKVFLIKVNGTELKHLMNFHLVDEQERHDVIAFLKEIKGKPACN